MKTVQKVIVSLNVGENPVEVGELVLQKQAVYFKYYTEFLNKGLEISPIN